MNISMYKVAVLLCVLFQLSIVSKCTSTSNFDVLDMASISQNGLDPARYIQWRKRQEQKRRIRKLQTNHKRKRKKKIRKKEQNSNNQRKLKTQLLIPKNSQTTEINASDDCPDIGGISGFTFLNFILSAVTIGANIVSNINSNSNNNNNNNNNNNDNINNVNIGD